MGVAKKLSSFLAAATAAAFTVPLTASANTPTLFDHDGMVAKGSKVLETTTNWVVSTSLSGITCGKVTGTSQVTQNSGSTFRRTGISGAATSCHLYGIPLRSITLKDLTFFEFHSAVAGSGTVSLTFEAVIPAGEGSLECHFTSAGVPFTYTASVTGDTLQITNGNLVATPPLCEPGTLSATFTLETDFSPYPPIWIQ